MSNLVPRELIEPLVKEGMTYRQVAERLGESFDSVRNAARQYGLRSRKYTAPRPAIPRDVLEPLVDEGLSYRKIGEILGETEGRVCYSAHKYELRPIKAKGARPEPIAFEVIRPLIDEGLSYQAIADRLGESHTRVRSAARRLGVNTRPYAPGAPLDPEVLGEFLNERISLVLIASRLNVPVHRVRHAIRINGLKTRDTVPPFTQDEMDWAVKARSEGVPIPWIAETLGRSSSYLQKRLQGPPGVSADWSTAWQGIRRNPDLLAFHREFAPVNTYVQSKARAA